MTTKNKKTYKLGKALKTSIRSDRDLCDLGILHIDKIHDDEIFVYFTEIPHDKLVTSDTDVGILVVRAREMYFGTRPVVFKIVKHIRPDATHPCGAIELLNTDTDAGGTYVTFYDAVALTSDYKRRKLEKKEKESNVRTESKQKIKPTVLKPKPTKRKK